MELMQRFRSLGGSDGGSGASGGAAGPTWLRNKKMVLGIVAGLAVASVVFVGGFFAGKDSHDSTDDKLENVVHAESRKESVRTQPLVLAPLKWDGVCPQKAAKCPQSYQGIPPLVVISLDGFHPDYLLRRFTPTLNKIAQCGVKAEFLYPVFPSKTFPNHYSIVTGLNPPSHGLIDNSIYEPFKRKLFKVGDPEMYQPYWYQKEPIWVTAERQGKKSASFYWVGSDVKINGSTPTYFKRYVSKMSFDARVDQILEWIDLPPSTRPSFLTLYVNQPDHAAHAHGTKSQQVNQALSSVDQMITRFFAGLQARNLVDCVNVVILSDHGMADTDCKNVVDIQNYMDMSQAFFTAGPFGRLRPKGRRNATIIAEMVSKLKCQNVHMQAYEKEQLPVRMHFADNARIEPIFLDLDNGWTVVSKSAKTGDTICSGGAHGYDNLYPSMRAIFMAHGPSIKQGLTIPPFINTELYELFAEMIDITPNPNNGTRGSLHHILKSPHLLSPQNQPDPPAISSVPEDERQYQDRVRAANCPCSHHNKQEAIQDIMPKKERHLPFGVPYSSEDNSTLRLLYNEDYILAFDLKYRIPMWTSFTLDGKKVESDVENICWTGDARIPFSDTANCGDYDKPVVKKQNVLQRPLYSPAFSDSSLNAQAAYVSNSIPKSLNHTNIIEKKLNQMLAEFASQNGQLNVMMGPAFDLLATGVRPDIRKIIRTHENNGPLTIPTHIFVVATRCSVRVDKIKDCETSKIQAQAFLLPNKPYPNNCESGETVIQRNVARIVDIEKLTGLSFYTGLPIYDAIRLRTMMPRRYVA